MSIYITVNTEFAGTFQLNPYRMEATVLSMPVVKSDYYGTAEIEIPCEFEHEGKKYAVKHIADGAFAGSDVRTVRLSNIETIGNYAFAGCASLCKVVGYDRVRVIGTGAFAGCGCVTSVDCPLVETISDFAFYDCCSLDHFGHHRFGGEKCKTLYCVKSIGVRAFYNTGFDTIILCNIKTKFKLNSIFGGFYEGGIFDHITRVSRTYKGEMQIVTRNEVKVKSN